MFFVDIILRKIVLMRQFLGKFVMNKHFTPENTLKIYRYNPNRVLRQDFGDGRCCVFTI
jgi:hypothetical protein